MIGIQPVHHRLQDAQELLVIHLTTGVLIDPRVLQGKCCGADRASDLDTRIAGRIRNPILALLPQAAFQYLEYRVTGFSLIFGDAVHFVILAPSIQVRRSPINHRILGRLYT